MIRERLLAAGFHRSTVARVLPPEAKSNPRGDSSKMLLNQNQNQIQTLSVENYQSEDLDKYPRQFLIKIIRYLEKKQTIKAGVHEIKAVEKEHDYPTKQILTQPTSIKNYYSPQLDANSPEQVCINPAIEILKKKQQPITFEDLIKECCQQNSQIAQFIGDKYLTKTNVKLRPILSTLLEHSNVKRVNQKTIVLSYI